jgi:hypothetical protein
MTWGDKLAQAYDAVAGTVRDAATNTVASIWNAAAAVKKATLATAKAAGNVATFAGRASGDIAMTAARGGALLGDKALATAPFVGQSYVAIKKISSPTKTPRETVTEPCPNTVEGKLKRLEQRKALIDLGSSPRATPEQNTAAERLARNNEAVELAKLSEDTYRQYGKPPKNDPPLGWAAMTPKDVVAAGIDPKLLTDSQAVIYQTPSDWPGGQKVVLAFRGTVPSEVEDLKTNFDQALGKETVQYEAAKALGTKVGEQFGTDVLVTGHSLGGGKAQAAGAFGGLRGIMFNAAGLNPGTVNNQLPPAENFVQFRSPGDPLTKIQNSAGLQFGVGLAGAIAMPLGATAKLGNFLSQTLGMPSLSATAADAAHMAATAFPRAAGNLLDQGHLLPPAIGKIIEAPSLNDEGKPTAASDLLGQHSVTNLVNGIEREKSEDVATLQATL